LIGAFMAMFFHDLRPEGALHISPGQRPGKLMQMENAL